MIRRYFSWVAAVLLTGTLFGAAELSLFWTDNSDNENGFVVERSIDGSNFVPVDTLGPNTESYVDQGLLYGIPYWYRVKAFNAAGDSGYSNVATATTGDAPVPPQAPGDAGIREQGELLNLSARAQIRNTGDGAFINGFVIGTAPVTVLIRGVGPTLDQYGVPDTLDDPQLTLFLSDGTPMGTNDNWSGQDVIDAAAKVNAFALPDGSLDAAFVVTLPPGAYTVHLQGVGGLEGNALMEIYKVP
jgi:hypothetical protein